MRELIQDFWTCPCWFPLVICLSWLVFVLARMYREDMLKRRELMEVNAKLERIQKDLGLKDDSDAI